jgi:septum formation protein
VLGSDSLVVVDGRRAVEMQFTAGKEAQVLGGFLAAALVRHGRIGMDCGDRAVLHVRPLSAAFIESYLAAEWPAVAGCVGVFRIEGPGVQLFDSIEGDYFSILGMPLFKVLKGLRQLGAMAE